MNLPNKLTIARIILSFFMVALLLRPGLGAKAGALAVFVVAALTDLWDGRIARRQGLISKFGVIMDPIADKILVLFAFLSFLKLGIAPQWMVVMIVARELLITGLRLIALVRGKALPAEAAGKMKAAAQMVTISLTLLFLVARELYPAGGSWVSPAWSGIQALMVLTVLLTLSSGFSFLWHSRKQIFS